MDPLDFISLAIRLSTSQNEADLRTAVSRAYYGAFHVARRFLSDCGVRWPTREMQSAEIHTKVRYCLRESANADAIIVSRSLLSLRDLRNKGDYDLESTKFKTTAKVVPIVRIRY